MIFDSTVLFSDGQAITATANSTNVVDLGVSRDIGKGVPVPLLIQVTEDFNNLVDLTVTVQTDTDEAFGAPTTLATSGAIPLADLVAGYQFPLQYMPTGTERYVRVTYTVSGATAPTQGKVTAGVVAGHQHGY
ncbi:hypothetical protein DFO67_10416 [Modicisalibacter xianhensis]|uniref:Uncharacterized protein n=1 Tax=Modicisalibacter xianhensis TaxID=442341 RepID=A0A4V3GUG4_9GAMM|nr:hypothetical protein [Halomonas xianhensis]TDX30761.1 hypothetical protein DFO67_10416 [Halomonas xianhensis]